VDDAVKAARRVQINAELIPLRSRRADNIIERNRFNHRIEDLGLVRNKLQARLSNDTSLARTYERHDSNISSRNYHGSRRDQYGKCIAEMAESVRNQQMNHQSNLERLRNHIERLRIQRDNLNTVINNQNNRITALESQLRNL